MTVTARDKRWEIVHSLWIGWTFTLGFFSWLAFAYIGLRARHTEWILWALIYATPHCGQCGTCTERKEAFELAGVPDPTIYRETAKAGS
jgi:hypothetical protein